MVNYNLWHTNIKILMFDFEYFSCIPMLQYNNIKMKYTIRSEHTYANIQMKQMKIRYPHFLKSYIHSTKLNQATQSHSNPNLCPRPSLWISAKKPVSLITLQNIQQLSKHQRSANVSNWNNYHPTQIHRPQNTTISTNILNPSQRHPQPHPHMQPHSPRTPMTIQIMIPS